MLTALGIIFGVAAVIAMLAIGNGAQQEILDQMKLVGVNNIIIMPKSESKMEEAAKEDEKGKQASEKFSPGLSIKDAESIKDVIPSVEKVSPEVLYESPIMAEGVSVYGKVSGVTPDFFDVFNLTLERGEMFNDEQLKFGKSVCILGSGLKAKLFPNVDPIGQFVKCGNVWLKVTGILDNRSVTENLTENLGISDYNNQVYAPIQTILLRYRDRSVVTTAMIRGGSSVVVFDGGMMSSSSDGEGSEDGNNQIDKIVVRVKETSMINQTSEVIKRMLTRRHAGVDDFDIKVPELLLKQEQRTKDIFNIVLRGNRIHLAYRRRNRHYEYYACLGNGTNQGNRHSHGHRRHPPRCGFPVPERSHHDQSFGGYHRDFPGPHPCKSHYGTYRYPHHRIHQFDRYLLWCFGIGRYSFWIYAREKSCHAGSGYLAAL